MSYSRRQLYALGEPLGDSATRSEGGRIVYGDGGGGGGSSTQTQTTDLPDWAKPYAKDILYQGSLVTDINKNPYKPYGGERTAQFTDLQNKAMGAAKTMGPSSQLGTATTLAGDVGTRAMGTNYQAGQFANQFQAPGAYQPGQFSMMQAQAPSLQRYQMQGPQDVRATGYDAAEMGAAQTAYNPNLQQYQMGPAERVRTQSFARPGAAEAYMSPYMQNVVDIQQREAQRQGDIARTGRGAQAVGAGAFGGSRQAIMEAEAARNLAQQKGDIQAQGLQSAYGQAQQQFNAEQQARLQAQQANQQAGLTVGGQNLGARLGVQQLGTQTGLQTALANLSSQQQANVQNQAARNQAMGMNAQQAMQAALANQQMGFNVGSQNLAANLGVQQLGAGQDLQSQLANQQAFQQAQQAGEQSRQFGAGQGLQAAGMGAQYGQAAQQLGEQSRQYGAGLGMQGLQTGLQAAGQLGALGGQQFQQGMDINKLQSAYGGMEQALNQRGLDQKYQDFLNQQNYQYKQLGFMSDLLRGTPTGSSSVTQMYQPEGSALGQLAGLGTGIYGLSKFMAEGGEVKSYAGDEGSVTSEQNVAEMARTLSDQQLQQALQNAQNRRDVNAIQAIQAELAIRASESRGMAGAFNMLPQESQDEVVQAAGGGIIAFADGDMVSDPMGTGASEIIDTPYQPTGMTGLQKFMSRFQNEPEWKIKEAEAKAMKEAKVSQAKPAAPSPKAQPKGQAARSTPDYVAPDQVPPAPAKEKPIDRRYEDLANAPKPSKAQVKSAVNELAEKYNLSPDIKEDVMKTAKEIRNELDKENAPMLEELRKAIDAQKPDTEAMRNKGIGQALAEFGFKFAAEAAKPGARFLGSAAAASPALSAASAKMQELETAANQNFAKLKLDQTKYEVALKKGDMQAASTLAAQIRQGQQQDRAFQLQLAQAQDNAQLEREKMAMTGDYYRSITSRQPENVMSLAKQLMQDPTFKGTQNDAIEKAAYLLKGGIPAGIREGTTSAANLDKALKDITAKYPLLKIMKTSDSEYASMKAAYDRDVQDAYARHGGAGISGAVPATGKKPSGVTVTEIGQ